MTKNLPSDAKRTNFCKILLHFLTPSIEVGEEDYHHEAAAAVNVIPGLWFEGMIGVVIMWEEQAATQA